MTEQPWGEPPPPPPTDPGLVAHEMAEMREEIEHLDDRQDHQEHYHSGGYHGGYHGGGYGYGQRPAPVVVPQAPAPARGAGVGLGEHVPTRYGSHISVGDLLGWLDYRVNEMHAALLEEHRHASRVPGSPVRLSGLDAVLNSDAAAFRAVTELGARLDRVEEKLDTLLARLPER